MTPQEIHQAQMAQQQDPRMQQAQMASQAQQGLGTPPQAPFEYQANPTLAKANSSIASTIDAQQQKLAALSQAQTQQGYAGYHGDPTAGVQTGSTQQGNVAHPNVGWTPASPEAHQLNIQLAERIKNGSIEPQTAMLALQHPEVSPEIKMALSQIVQQSQAGGSGNTVQTQPAGLGQVQQQ
jgi:hypothetical protein